MQAASFNPLANGGNGGLNYTGCSALCLGTEGQNMFYGHGLNNFDLTLEKRVPIGKEGRRAFRFQFQAYNAFNHPQFTSQNTSDSFTVTFCNAGSNNPCNLAPQNGGAANYKNAIGASTLIVPSGLSANKTSSTFLGQATGTTGYRILSGNIRFEF